MTEEVSQETPSDPIPLDPKEKRRLYQKEYSKRPHVVERRKKYMQEYRKSDKAKATRKKYLESERGKEVHRKCVERYRLKKKNTVEPSKDTSCDKPVGDDYKSDSE